MCMGSICPICHHKSWTGCGKHIASVMDDTPRENWCTCEGVDSETGEYPRDQESALLEPGSRARARDRRWQRKEC